MLPNKTSATSEGRLRAGFHFDNDGEATTADTTAEAAVLARAEHVIRALRVSETLAESGDATALALFLDTATEADGARAPSRSGFARTLDGYASDVSFPEVDEADATAPACRVRLTLERDLAEAPRRGDVLRLTRREFRARRR